LLDSRKKEKKGNITSVFQGVDSLLSCNINSPAAGNGLLIAVAKIFLKFFFGLKMF
jgi:hypothetical protein